MTRKAHFVDAFWDEDICSDKGFKALVQKMNHSRATCKEVLEYITERAKIEEEYAKKLEDAGKILKGANENGSLKLVINQLKQNAAEVSFEHMSISKTLMERVTHLSKHTETLKQQISQCEDSLKNSYRKTKEAHSKMQDAKKAYENKCKDKELTEEQHSTMISSSISNPKDVEKLSKRSTEARENYRKADQFYRTTCNNLEVARLQFVKDMESSCLTLEQAEESRIYTLINDLWILMNVVSFECVAVNKSNEEVRNAIRKCNVDKDIELSIENYGTGTLKPKEIPFVEYRFQDAGGFDPRTVNRLGRPPLVGGATNSRS